MIWEILLVTIIWIGKEGLGHGVELVVHLTFQASSTKEYSEHYEFHQHLR